jgi:hypothetical protein
LHDAVGKYGRHDHSQFAAAIWSRQTVALFYQEYECPDQAANWVR